MNNDEVYIEFTCDTCGEPDYNIKTCNKCKLKYCTYKCIDKILQMTTNPICRHCYEEKKIEIPFKKIIINNNENE